MSADSSVARWLRENGYFEIERVANSLPIYTGVNMSRVYVVANKTTFSWSFTRRRWETGVDRANLKLVERFPGSEVYVLFSHRNKTPSQRDLDNGSPEESPVGLFVARLLEYSHRSDKYGRGGMLYWHYSKLQRLEKTEEALPKTKGFLSPALWGAK